MNNKTKILLLVILVAILVGLLIWLSVLNNKANEELTVDKSKFDSISSINDYETFLSITNIIDELYLHISNLDSNYIVDVYSTDYLVNNGLNTSNIINKVNENSLNISKYLANNYYTCSDYNCYIYVELEGLSSNYNGSYYKKLDNELLQIIIDLENNTYSITPLINDRELIEYTNNHSNERVLIERNESNNYVSINYDDKKIINYYLQYVKYLIIANSDNVNNYVSNFLKSESIDYLNKLGNTLYSYNKKEENGYIEYVATLFDGTSFNLINYAPMNFKIMFYN